MLSQIVKAGFAYDRIVEVPFDRPLEVGRRGTQSGGLETGLESLAGPVEVVSIFVAGRVSPEPPSSMPGWLYCALASSHWILFHLREERPCGLGLPGHSILPGERGWTLPGMEDWLLGSALVLVKSC